MKPLALFFLLMASFAAAQTPLEVLEMPGAVSIKEQPDHWKTGHTGKPRVAGKWEIISAGNPVEKSYTIKGLDEAAGTQFNLSWHDQFLAIDVKISVRLFPLSGKTDQGGGLVWHMRDESNYYLARYNPLEDNFRIYFVKDGERKVLASTPLELESGKWIAIEIIQTGSRISGTVNGKLLLDLSDTTFQTAGKVGLWTKADASTAFTGFKVEKIK